MAFRTTLRPAGDDLDGISVVRRHTFRVFLVKAVEEAVHVPSAREGVETLADVSQARELGEHARVDVAVVVDGHLVAAATAAEILERIVGGLQAGDPAAEATHAVVTDLLDAQLADFGYGRLDGLVVDSRDLDNAHADVQTQFHRVHDGSTRLGVTATAGRHGVVHPCVHAVVGEGEGDMAVDEDLPQPVFDDRAVGVDFDLDAQPGGRLDEQADVGVERRLSADELHVLHAQHGGFGQDTDPVPGRHATQKRQVRTRLLVAVDALQVALAGEFEPEEGELVAEGFARLPDRSRTL
ncbi:MAG: hypothetical protein NUV84_03995 [Candidatus Uhrbacteria bacterium]|nr:hypothetical protein [Candidatus Uhrbacteria bacterium]